MRREVRGVDVVLIIPINKATSVRVFNWRKHHPLSMGRNEDKVLAHYQFVLKTTPPVMLPYATAKGSQVMWRG